MSNVLVLENLKLAYGLTWRVDSSFAQSYLCISCKVCQLQSK